MKEIKIRRFCSWLLGLTFVFSSVTKLMDPVGTSYIVTEYFKFFHLDFLTGAAKGVGILLSFIEASIGILLTSGIFRKITMWISLGVLGFFLIITGALVIFNPQMDCGCFGESIHLSHFQTFVKNLLLLALAAGAWLGIRDFGTPKKSKYVAAGISAISILVFCIFSLIGIPLKDYTDFAAGRRILAADPYATVSKKEWQTLFIYEKDGVRDSVDRPFSKAGWDYVGMKNRIVRQSYPMPALPLRSEDGTEMEYLMTDGPVMLITLYEKPSEKKWEGICRFAEDAQATGFTSLILADEAYYHNYPIYLSDKKTLSTVNRSNGGVTYLYDGDIIGKWSYAGRPNTEKLEEIFEKDCIEMSLELNAARDRSYQAFMLYVFAVLLLL